jgi:uncharacterized protein YndB with AHSA1/START domain
MTSTTEKTMTTQVYRVYIRATPEAIWDAITKPEWTEKYGYGGLAEFDLQPGGAFRLRVDAAMITGEEQRGFSLPDVIIDGEVIEADPPRKLVQTWRMLMDADLASEPSSRLTWEIEGADNGVSTVTVTHDLTDAPKTAALVAGAHEAEGAGGGWNWVLSDLKTFLETGSRMATEETG